MAILSDDSSSEKLTEGRLSFIVLGAAKCGTTALYDMLSQHSSIRLPHSKDFHYFDYDENYMKGPSWYWKHFKDCKGELLGEVAANYLYSEKAMDRIAKDFGEQIKVIIILRDPVERLISEYKHHQRNGTLSRTLGYYLSSPSAKSENDRYTPWHLLVERSEYFKWLQKVYKRFNRDNVLLLSNEKLKEEPQMTMQRVFHFLNLEQVLVKPLRSNEAYKPKFIFVNKMIKGPVGRLFRLALPSKEMRRWIKDKIRKANTSKKTLGNRVIRESVPDSVAFILEQHDLEKVFNRHRRNES